MFLNIMMAVGIYPVFLVMYVVLKKHLTPQKGRYFSVSFKKEWLEEEETRAKIEEVKNGYLKGLRCAFFLSAIVPVVCFFTPYVSIQITIWCLWIFAAMVIFYLPFLRANKDLRQWKETKGWNAQVSPTRYVELREVGQVRCVKWKQYIAPLFVLSLTAISGIVYRMSGRAAQENPAYEAIFWVFYVTFLLCVVAFGAVAVMMDKRSVEVISKDSEVNLNYARARKNVWKLYWQWVTRATVVMQVATAAMLWTDVHFLAFALWGSVVYTVLVLAVSVKMLGKLSRVEQEYRDKTDEELFTDDDKYWIGGIIYYNPNDKRSMVETRVGTGTTTNMARPLGKVLDIIAFVTILFCVIMCAWVILEEFTPISLEVQNVSICAEHLGLEYEIAVEDITEIACVTELPKMSKTNGSAMDNLRKGKFYISEEKRKCIVFLNPQNDLFLRVGTEDMVYFIGGADDAETKVVYDAVVGLVE